MYRKSHDPLYHILAVLCLALFSCPGPAGADSRLLCEWQASPTAVADRCPEFFWETEGQSAYRIIVSSSDLTAALTLGDMWDSGKVETSLQIAEYGGKPLQNGKTYAWRLTIWDAEGKAGPWSEIQHFTMAFRDLPRHLHHIRTFVNFGSKPNVIASRYDLTFRKEAKEFRADVITINYSLLATMVIPSEKEKGLAEFCAKNGLAKIGIPEDMFVHFREDAPVRLHVGAENMQHPVVERVVPGWDPANDKNGDGIVDDEEFKSRANPNASARKMMFARVPIYYWGPPQDDFVMNVGNKMFQKYLAEVYIQGCIKGYDGLFIDTTTAHIPAPAGKLLEYPREREVQDGAWLRDMQTMLARVKLAIGDKLFTANCWAARPFVLDGTEWENWLNISCSASRIRQALEQVADIDRRGKIQMVQYNPVYDPGETEFGVKVPVDKDRDRIFGLALYYLINGDFTYFGFGQHPYRKSEEKYFPAIEYNIGKPKGPYFVFASATADIAGENLLKNGGFESDEDGDGNPDEWTVQEPLEIAKDAKREGKCSAKIVSTSGEINNITRQYVTLKPNTTYTLSGWIRTDKISKKGAAQIYPYEFEGADFGGGAILMTAGDTQDWKLYTQVFKTGNNPKGRICFRVFGAIGTAWFDDIRLVEGAYYSWEILGREYEKALVLVEPAIGKMYGDDTAATHDLDGVYRPLKADGSLGDPIQQVPLRSGEAAILIRQE